MSYAADWVRDKRRSWKRDGLCANCGGAPATHGIYCKTCRETYRGTIAESHAARRAAGLCRCGREREDADFSLCARCREASRLALKRGRLEKKYGRAAADLWLAIQRQPGETRPFAGIDRRRLNPEVALEDRQRKRG